MSTSIGEPGFSSGAVLTTIQILLDHRSPHSTLDDVVLNVSSVKISPRADRADSHVCRREMLGRSFVRMRERSGISRSRKAREVEPSNE